MSHRATTWAWDVPDLTAHQRCLLLALADCMNEETGKCCPSQAFLAKKVGMSTRSVRDGLTMFEERGLLIRHPQFRDGARTSDHFDLKVEALPNRMKGGAANPAGGSGAGRQGGAESPADRTGNRNQEENQQVREAFDLYNATAETIPAAAKAEDLTDQRRKAIRARLEKGGIERWKLALRALASNRFLCGEIEGRRGAFKPTLDFVLQPSSYQKLVEGHYEQDRDPEQGATSPMALSDWPVERWARVVREWRATGEWPPYAGPEPGLPGCACPPDLLR